jgi:midasin (ATPase involved in ribosome maturation)
MSLLHATNDLYESRFGARNGLIVVTLEETFDSKNLVGTYVCSETGEFVFKKGPLTVAAEQGMWLVLRNIEDTPSDLLSFLLPLVQSNLLQVTSTWTINPKLGFRLFMLSKQD